MHLILQLSFIIPCYPWHIRLHLIDNKRKINLLAGSFSAPDDGYLQDDSTSSAYYQSSKGRIGIKTFEHTLDCSITFPEPNTNLLYPKTALAQGTATLVPGSHTLLLACLGDAFSNEVAKEIEATLSGNILSYSYDGKKYQVTLEEL